MLAREDTTRPLTGAIAYFPTIYRSVRPCVRLVK